MDAGEGDSDGTASSKLSDDAVANITMDMLLAGHETTATTLCFTSYLLATNPDVQEKLQREIAGYYQSNPVRVGMGKWVAIIFNFSYFKV